MRKDPSQPEEIEDCSGLIRLAELHQD